MTDVLSLLNRDAIAGGVFLTDPRDILRWLTPTISAYQSGGWRRDTVEPDNFFALVDSYGDITATDYAANTYKTITDVAGAGHLYHIIGPRSRVATTCAIRITVDNVSYEIPVSAMPAERRQGLGLREEVAFPATSGDSAVILYPRGLDWTHSGAVSFIDGHIAKDDSASVLASFGDMYKANQVLKFVDGLKVEAKIGSIASMVSSDHKSGCIYRML